MLIYFALVSMLVGAFLILAGGVQIMLLGGSLVAAGGLVYWVIGGSAKGKLHV